MGCQKKIVKSIRAKKSNYVMAAKNNQKTLYKEIENLFIVTNTFSEHKINDIDHGRAETRRIL